MIRAITIRQPWALCVASGHKNVENRGRNISYRGEIAIHAGRAHDPAGDVDPRVLRLWGRDPRVGAAVGAILAVGELVDCHKAEEPVRPDATCCWPWGERYHNNGPAFHLVLEDIRQLERPVPCRGALPIGWAVPAEVEEQVRAQLAGVTR